MLITITVLPLTGFLLQTYAWFGRVLLEQIIVLLKISSQKHTNGGALLWKHSPVTWDKNRGISATFKTRCRLKTVTIWKWTIREYIHFFTHHTFNLWKFYHFLEGTCIITQGKHVNCTKTEKLWKYWIATVQNDDEQTSWTLSLNA